MQDELNILDTNYTSDVVPWPEGIKHVHSHEDHSIIMFPFII